jgi:purine-binding chemotaxis protein CheW
MDEHPQAGTEISRFLTFRSNGRLYALPAAEVAEIIPVPPVARLPQSPKALLGMANLRGSVIAVGSLRALLGVDAETAEPAAPARSARAIVLDGAAPVAITVDAVERLVTLARGRIETRQSKLAADPGERLRGMFLDGSDDAAKILDLPALLTQGLLPRIAARPGGLKMPTRAGLGQNAGKPQAETISQTRALVTFDVANQRYALDLSDVREIIALPPEIALVPHAEALILGLVSYRDQLLPLLSLRGLLGFPLERDARNKIIVTTVAGGLVGLVADRMRAILQADPAAIEPAPKLLAARAGGETQIDALYRDKNGGLTSLLATAKLFGDEVMARLGTHASTETTISTTETAEQLQFLIFRLAGEEFALPISAVDEVAAVPEKITRLPKTPKFLRGVVNLRGEVLPVIDQRSRFDLPKFADGGSRQRLVVLRSARHHAGLIVDGISEVLSTSADAMEPAPHLADEEGRLVRGVINLEAARRMILVLDPDELLTRTERSLLDIFNASTKTTASGKAPRRRNTAP